jgi:glutamine synthetase
VGIGARIGTGRAVSLGSTGRDRFVARHGLWSDAQHEAAEQAVRVIEETGVDLVRLAFPDTHGTLRGKTLATAAFVESALANGHTAPSTLVLKDTSGRTAYPVFRAGGAPGLPGLGGVADIMLVPDPVTFRVLPWASRTAWVLCDLYFPDGRPVPLATRHLYRAAVEEAAARGYDFVTGLELEFHVFRLDDPMHGQQSAEWAAPPPRVTSLSHGYQLASEDRLDGLDGVVQLISGTARALGLPLRSVELELGPSQFEVTFDPQAGLPAADNAVLFRSAVKQACRRNGYHATFMCRPGLPGIVSSGWHLHQSLRDLDSGANAFAASAGEEPPLSAVGRGYLGGILAHAAAASVFAAPTVNGYKRYQPNSLAPDRVAWGIDNRGAMIRVVGAGGDPGTRLENRAGEPAANPYLYLASQLISGLDGLDRGLDPGEPVEEPYVAAAPPLPRTLSEAIAALESDELFAKRFGPDFIAHLLTVKRAELTRFLSAVTDWEHREYFDLF